MANTRSRDACSPSVRSTICSKDAHEGHDSIATPTASVHRFPLLARELSGRPLVFLDNASTTPKPRGGHRCSGELLRALDSERSPAGVHSLGEEATTLFDDARREVASLIGASPGEIVLVRGTTEAHQLRRQRPRARPPRTRWGVPGQRASRQLDSRGRLHAKAGAGTDRRGRSSPLGAHREPDHQAHEAHLDRPRLERHRRDSLRSKRWCASRRRTACRSCSMPRSRSRTCRSTSRSSASISSPPRATRRSALRGVGILWGKKEFLAKCPLYQVGGGMTLAQQRHRRRRLRPTRCAVQVRGGHAGHRGDHRLRAPRVKWDARHRAWTPIREHDLAMSKYPDSNGLRRHRGLCASLAARLPPAQRIALATFVVDAPAMTQESVARALCDMFGRCACRRASTARTCSTIARICPGTRAGEPTPLQHDRGEIDVLLEGVREIAS